MVDWPHVYKVMHKRCFGNGTHEHGCYLDGSPSNPRLEGVTTSQIKVHIELRNYLIYRRAVILHHIGPSLGLEHCLYPQGTLVELCHLYSSLDDNSAPTIVEVETVPDLILSEACPVVDEVLILLVSGSAGFPNKPSEFDPLPAVSLAPTSSITTFGSDLVPWAS
jgi:hypothetical protein